MKKRTLIFVLFFTVLTSYSQGVDKKKDPVFKNGEWLRYKMSYSGWMRAGTAVLKLEEKELHGKKVYHATGTGWTSGVIKWFFKVDDTYESYFDKKIVIPYFFKRKIDEGGYKKNRNTTFNYTTNEALVEDFIKKKDTLITFSDVQDMLSSFYYLRNQNVDTLKKGEEIRIDMFLDSQIYPFKLRFLGKETLKTKVGKVKTLKFRPLVQAGRIFKAQESVTIWITADKNKIPIKMNANLSVGSLRADLEAYKGLANSFEKVFN
jgi:hypothetical protein